MQVLAAEDSHLLTGQGIQHNMRKVEMMHVLFDPFKPLVTAHLER